MRVYLRGNECRARARICIGRRVYRHNTAWHTLKQRFWRLFKSKFIQKKTVSNVIHVYKSKLTSQPMWNNRISYFFINKRANLFADIQLKNIVEVFMYFWNELRGVKRVTVKGNITVFRGTFKFDNFYFKYQIEADQVNFSPFFRFELRTPVCTAPYPLMCTWARCI